MIRAGVLLLAYGAGNYGDEALSAMTGWPVEWSYAICQAVMISVLWCWLLIGQRGPARWICAAGVCDSLMRAGCSTAQMIRPVYIGSQTVCEAHTGADINSWGLAVLAGLAGAVWITTRGYRG